MNRERLVETLIRDEGIRTEMYLDIVNKWTIGVGHNLSDNGITKAQAMRILDDDLDAVFAELDYKMPWWSDSPPHIQMALANMAFNMGVPRLLGFKKMLAALKKDKYEMAADEALDSKWATQVGVRARHIADLIRDAG